MNLTPAHLLVMQCVIGASSTLDRWRSEAQICGLTELANAPALLEELFAAGFIARTYMPVLGLHLSHSVTMYRTIDFHRRAFWREWEVQHG
jgi:hypothetical protein